MYATDKKEIDHNDYWYIKDNPLSKIGVFPYLGRQISSELDPDKIYNVLRPEEELNNEETLQSFKLVPIVNDHTMLGTKEGMQPAEQKGVHGVIGEDVYFKDGIIYGDLKIFSETLKEEIENGKKELSMGYFCDYELKDGEFNGEQYQAIQRNLRINHVALVDEGRMGADVRVMDSKIVFDCMDILKDNLTQKEGKNELDTNKNKGENTMSKEQKKSLGKSALDEDIDEMAKDECGTKDEDVDKRQLIDEIGGILKDKVDEELLRTVMEKAEKLAYNDSETGANDEDIENKEDDKEDDKPAEDEIIEENPLIENEDPQAGAEVKVEVSMDAMIKEIAKRDNLVDAIKPIIGENANFKSMTTSQVAKYACDKLDLKPAKGQEYSTIKGYVAAHKKFSKQTYSLDSKPIVSNGKDAAFEKYINE